MRMKDIILIEFSSSGGSGFNQNEIDKLSDVIGCALLTVYQISLCYEKLGNCFDAATIQQFLLSQFSNMGQTHAAKTIYRSLLKRPELQDLQKQVTARDDEKFADSQAIPAHAGSHRYPISRSRAAG